MSETGLIPMNKKPPSKDCRNYKLKKVEIPGQYTRYDIQSPVKIQQILIRKFHEGHLGFNLIGHLPNGQKIELDTYNIGTELSFYKKRKKLWKQLLNYFPADFLQKPVLSYMNENTLTHPQYIWIQGRATRFPIGFRLIDEHTRIILDDKPICQAKYRREIK
jgi:hypothetical protein